MQVNKKILADSWYANTLTGDVTTVQQYLDRTYHGYILQLSNIRVVRGILLFLAARKFDIVVTTLGGAGVTTFTIIQALLGKNRRKVILLEFFRPAPEALLKKLFWPIWTKRILGPCLRRTLLKAQVLTQDEIKRYGDTFLIPRDRFAFVPWPLHNPALRKSVTQFASTNYAGKLSNYVMSSGMANVDWETLFEVANKSEWPFLAVCNRANLDRVNKLNKNNRATVLCDIPQDVHARYVKDASVYALSVRETHTSVGHIRLMNAVELGTAVVASDVSGLKGYIRNGINCITVPPADVDALKAAIDTLLGDEQLRQDLARNASCYQPDRTFDRYISEIVHLVEGVMPAGKKEKEVKPAA